MDCQLVLSPELNLSPEEFVATWNASPDLQDAADARAATTAEQYDPFTATGVVLSSIAVGLATNALYDMIKHVLTRHDVKQQVEIVEVEQSDGTRVIVVKVNEQ